MIPPSTNAAQLRTEKKSVRKAPQQRVSSLPPFANQQVLRLGIINGDHPPAENRPLRIVAITDADEPIPLPLRQPPLPLKLLPETLRELLPPHQTNIDMVRIRPIASPAALIESKSRSLSRFRALCVHALRRRAGRLTQENRHRCRQQAANPHHPWSTSPFHHRIKIRKHNVIHNVGKAPLSDVLGENAAKIFRRTPRRPCGGRASSECNS